MLYIPHEKLSFSWMHNEKILKLSLPWVSMDIEVTEDSKEWIKDALTHLHSQPTNKNAQQLIHNLKAYPIFYFQPRSLAEFKEKDLELSPQLFIDSSTPSQLIATFSCEVSEKLRKNALSSWAWEREKILSKAQIPGSELYDPVSLVSYLICYRLEWESTTWSGQNGFGSFLANLLKHNEKEFFQAIGWVSKQSWYTTKKFSQATMPALYHFKKAKDLILNFISDELGHYKFMEDVFRNLRLNKDAFPVSDATQWLLAAYERAAVVSPLAFSAMINLFEAAYYEGEDPISSIIKKSSKPYAARGFDLHYKINQEHRHCDMPLLLASRLAPQTYAHAILTLSLFELAGNFLDREEEALVRTFSL